MKEEVKSIERERIKTQGLIIQVNRQVEEKKIQAEEREARILKMKELKEKVEGENEELER